MPETIVGLILVGGAMFGLGFLTSLWITFGAVKTEPTYWTTTAKRADVSDESIYWKRWTTKPSGPGTWTYSDDDYRPPAAPSSGIPPLPPPNYSLMGTTKDGPLRTPPPPPERD